VQYHCMIIQHRYILYNGVRRGLYDNRYLYMCLLLVKYKHKTIPTGNWQNSLKRPWRSCALRHYTPCVNDTTEPFWEQITGNVADDRSRRYFEQWGKCKGVIRYIPQACWFRLWLGSRTLAQTFARLFGHVQDTVKQYQG
jgi:hypothetical protein